MIKRIRIFLLKLLIGRWQVVANMTFDVPLELSGQRGGFIWRNIFTGKPPTPSLSLWKRIVKFVKGGN